ncbi:MAG: flagellar export protein FliJ [Pseudomonadales bacterium]|nr:flagellar export protein FliJ [Pseudomonadales bacterium]
MKKSQRLLPVRQLKQQEERTEAKKLAQVQQELAAAKQQLQELDSYLKDYFNTVSSQQSQIHNAAQLGQYQNFITRLKEAISRQNQDVMQREQALKMQSKKWFEASSRLKVMDDLIEKARLEEQREQDKKEQKLQDDRPFRLNGGFH